MFGHRITLNFNKQGDTYNTVLGGIISIFLRLIFIYLLYVKSQDVYHRKNIDISSGTKPTDYDEIGLVNLKEVNFRPFVAIKK